MWGDRRKKLVLVFFSALAFSVYMYLVFFHALRFSYLPISDYPVLFLFAFGFLYFTDNISIRYKGIRLITNVIGYMPLLVLFGPVISCTSLVLTRFFRINEERKDALLFRKIRGTVYYTIYYSLASIVYDYLADLSVLIALISFVSVFKLLNIIVLSIENPSESSIKERFKGALNDFPLFIVNVPSSYIISRIYNHSGENVLTFLFLGYYFSNVVLAFYWMMIRNRTNYSIALKRHEELQEFKEGLEKILQVFKTIKLNESLESFLEDIAKILAEFFECRYVLISIFNHEKGVAERIAGFGIEEKEFEKLRNNPPSIEEVRELLRPEYKMGSSYFIPHEESVQKVDSDKVFTGEYRSNSLDNDSWKPFDLFIIPLKDLNGEMIGYASLDGPINGKRPTEEQVKILEIFVEQIASFIESSKEYSQILHKSLTDGLTGLYNHSHFYNYLERLIAKSSKERWDFSLIVIDLDNFKQINNAFGHLFGDLVLKKLAKIIKSSIRELDSVFRYGGDEFVVVLPGISKKIAREIAERLLKNIRNVEFEDGIRITASIGISSFPEDGETAQSLFESADRALYISKTLGKNTITAA